MLVKAEMKAVAKKKKAISIWLKLRLLVLTLAMESNNSQSQGQKSEEEDTLHLSPGALLASTQRKHLPKLEPIRVELA